MSSAFDPLRTASPAAILDRMEIRPTLFLVALGCAGCSAPFTETSPHEHDLAFEARRAEAACGLKSGAVLKRDGNQLLIHSDDPANLKYGDFMCVMNTLQPWAGRRVLVTGERAR